MLRACDGRNASRLGYKLLRELPLGFMPDGGVQVVQSLLPTLLDDSRCDVVRLAGAEKLRDASRELVSIVEGRRGGFSSAILIPVG